MATTTGTGAKKINGNDNWREIFDDHNDSVDAYDTLLGKLKGDIAIIEDGDSATHNLTTGQYVLWKGSLYKVSQNISTGTALSTNNLSAVSNGIGEEVSTLSTNINTTYRDIYGSGSINNCDNAVNGKWYHVYPSASNIPINGLMGIIFTYGNNADKHQIYAGESRFFVRRYTNSAWTSWEELSLKKNTANKQWTLIASTNNAHVNISDYSEIMIIMFDSDGSSILSNIFPVSAVPTSGDKWVGVYDWGVMAWARIVNGNSFRMGNPTNYPAYLYAR